MDKFTKTGDSDSEEEHTFHTLGSDEEFFGNVANSDDENSDNEEKQMSSKTKAKKSFDAFADETDSEEEQDYDDKSDMQTKKQPKDKKQNEEPESRKSTEAKEEEENMNELHRVSKLAKFKASKKPKGKTGVVYFSRIPPYMKPAKMRQILKRFGDVDRIFLKKEDPKKQKMRVKGGGNKKACYEEGWAEFIKKKDAKVCADTLNGNILGGKKGNFYHDDIMNVKYLSGFKWTDLTAQMNAEQESRQSKLQMEISQAKKLNSTFVSNIEKSKYIAKIQKRDNKTADDEIYRSFAQRSVRTTRADGDEKFKESNTNKLDNVLSNVF